jgi:hypothetical protein
MQRSSRRTVLIAVLAISLSPIYIGLAKPPAEEKNQTFKGKVVPLAELLGKFAKLDEDAAPHMLALAADDGKIYPLIKDDGSRMFFKDAKLLRRPMRITGRLHPQSQMLQVINVHSYVKGQLHDIYYWCDICSIKAFEAGPCGCCNAPLVFREVPAK